MEENVRFKEEFQKTNANLTAQSVIQNNAYNQKLEENNKEMALTITDLRREL